jgi:hypothetical protein
VLPNPPRVPLEEVAIEIQYARMAPEAKQMFEWAHVLHRQSYDVLADERLSQAEKDERWPSCWRTTSRGPTSNSARAPRA